MGTRSSTAPQPLPDKLIQICFGLGLDVEEAQALLKKAEQSPLYPNFADAAVMRCLHDGKPCSSPGTADRLGLRCSAKEIP
jgi:hypothetical protein